QPVLQTRSKLSPKQRHPESKLELRRRSASAPEVRGVRERRRQLVGLSCESGGRAGDENFMTVVAGRIYLKGNLLQAVEERSRPGRTVAGTCQVFSICVCFSPGSCCSIAPSSRTWRIRSLIKLY
ncbi:unnamed protein product, partial [Nesidiocoris tenuis]